MKLAFLDFETTGVDPKECRPIELCVMVHDTETLGTTVHESRLWCDSYGSISQEIFELTGINEEKARLGRHPKDFLESVVPALATCDYLVAHNARGFDKIVLEQECARQNVPVPRPPWIDTMTDLPYPKKFRCRKLSHLAVDHGIHFDPATLHGAKADVTLLRQIFESYPLAQVILYATSPVMLLKARVNYDTRELAKKAGYSWEKAGEHTVPKSWVKLIREVQLEEEKQLAKDGGFAFERL